MWIVVHTSEQLLKIELAEWKENKIYGMWELRNIAYTERSNLLSVEQSSEGVTKRA